MPGPQFLSAEQVLLTTLVVKLAVMAALATMLVRYRRFRHILIFERRGWGDRLILAMALGLPLTAGVASRLLLNYNAADLTLEGAFVVGLIAGPYTGAIVGLVVGLPPLANGEIIALPFAVGCGFAGGGLRELCPKEAIWHFSPFDVTRLPVRIWHMLRQRRIDWQVVLLVAPLALELIRQALGFRWSDHHRLFYLHPEPFWTLAVILLATVLAVATPIKIWNNARIEHRLEEQEKLLLAARIEALSNRINPHFLFNTLTSISSLIRTQPDTARMLITKLSGLLRRLMRSTDHFVSLREELESIDRVPGHRGGAIRSAAEGRQGREPRDARRHRPQHAAAAAHRELHQARALAQGGRRTHHDPHHAQGRSLADRSGRRWSGYDGGTPQGSARRGHRSQQRERAAPDDLRRGVHAEARQHHGPAAPRSAWRFPDLVIAERIPA
ncbi:MAG: histidine kinase [Vicinamibacterales bacterium]